MIESNLAAVPDNENIFFLGIDGGGSQCRASLAAASGETLGHGLAGTANPLEGQDKAVNSILEATGQALREAGLTVDNLGNIVAGLGLAGVNLPGLHHTFSEWTHPFKSIYLTTDLHAACLGAHQGKDGAVIIIGTGSCGFARVKGQTAEYGGHGFPLGDMGSAAWMGFKAVQHSLLALDGLLPGSRLAELLLARFEYSEPMALVERMARETPSEYGKLARIVFAAAEENDAAAIAIIREGAGYISTMARKLLELNPQRLSLLGGLAPLIEHWLDPDVAAHVTPPLDNAEAGAIYLARQGWAEERAAS